MSNKAVIYIFPNRHDQLSLCRKYCKQNSLEIVTEVFDYDTGQPGLQMLHLSAITEDAIPPFGAIVVASEEVLQVGWPMTTGEFESSFEKAGITLHIASGD